MAQHPIQTPGGAICSTVSIGPVLSADEPTSPKKPKSVPEPTPRDTDAEVTSSQPSEWTSVRIGPGEDAVGEDVLAVRVLVTSEDSRYAQIVGWRQRQGDGGVGCT